MIWQVINADALEGLRSMPDASVRCCVTSPPYWGLRDYGVEGQLGLEPTPETYISRMVAVLREVRRVLADDGTLWLNIGDSYAGGGKGGNPPDSDHQKQKTNRGSILRAGKHEAARQAGAVSREWQKPPFGCKSKDLIGIPWLLAFALRSDGWYLRSDIIWSKPNPMPESVTDRPTRAHEYVFLLSKSRRYFYDAAAIAEPASFGEPNSPQSIASPHGQGFTRRASDKQAETAGALPEKRRGHARKHQGFNDRWDAMERAEQCSGTRNKRSVWAIATQPYPEAHFATFPPALVDPCIRAGSAEGDTVLDPFCGSGTTGQVALELGRNFIGIELNPEYVDLSRKRIGNVAPLLAQEVAS